MANAEFYRVVWTINALLIIRSEMLPFSENNENNFRSPPEHFAIGYVHNNSPLDNIALQYVISNICRKVWWCFLMIPCTLWRSRIFGGQIHQNYLVALSRSWTPVVRDFALCPLNVHCMHIFCTLSIRKSWIPPPPLLQSVVQWNLIITRSLGPWKLLCYIRFLIISG